VESPETARATSIPGIELRPYRDDEIDFLLQLYATTRADEMRLLLDWSDQDKDAFVRSQFQLQHEHYTKFYAEATFDLVTEEGEPIGRFYVHRSPGEVRLMEVTLLPDKRNRGIGGALTRELVSEAARREQVVVLHVESWNPAIRLYERLGFVKVGDETGVNLRMECRPGE
jgi:ribosomal protein S18 acetylase RimI-like enzyme